MKLLKFALALAALAPLASYAALGGAPVARTHVVATPRSLLQSTTTAGAFAAAASYTVREAKDADGVTIREYVLPTNVVFAVTWQGPVRPDMTELLGSYFQNFASPGEGQARGIGPMVQHNSAFHIESAGHAGYFFGKAYLPRLVPAHVRMETLQ
jgi:Protein of unknown function (DUF2844)